MERENQKFKNKNVIDEFLPNAVKLQIREY